jgi:ribonuclease R
LLTHRAIKAILLGKKYEPKIASTSVLNTNVSNATRKQQAKDKAEGKEKKAEDLTVWDALGVHCSANERRADEASRDVENWLKCYFMQDKLGEEYTGIITGVTTFGIFAARPVLSKAWCTSPTGRRLLPVRRCAPRAARRAHRQDLPADRPRRVQVVRVDLEARKIDLRLATGAALEPRRWRRPSLRVPARRRVARSSPARRCRAAKPSRKPAASWPPSPRPRPRLHPRPNPGSQSCPKK